MKVSVSMSESDVAFLDEYADEHQIESRSAAVQRAIKLLRATELGNAYESAWDEWTTSGAAELWEPFAGDGLGD